MDDLLILGKTITLSGPITMDAGKTLTVTGTTGSNTLQGPNVDNLWTISSLGSGDLIPATGEAVSFSNIQTAVGGSGNDTFSFADGATFYFIDGGGDAPEVNILDYTLFTTTAHVNWTNHTASNLLSGFIHIQEAIGNYVVDTPTISIDTYTILKLYLALNQTNTFLNRFAPADIFLYQKYDVKDYALIENLNIKQKNSIPTLHPLLLQQEEINNITFKFSLLPQKNVFFTKRMLKKAQEDAEKQKAKNLKKKELLSRQLQSQSKSHEPSNTSSLTSEATEKKTKETIFPEKTSQENSDPQQSPLEQRSIVKMLSPAENSPSNESITREPLPSAPAVKAPLAQVSEIHPIKIPGPVNPNLEISTKTQKE
jgi:hypothetical protein